MYSTVGGNVCEKEWRENKSKEYANQKFGKYNKKDYVLEKNVISE